MITGNIEERLYPRVFVTLVTALRDITEKMLVDTGFDYDLAMHYDEADRLELELMDYIEVEYASGDSLEEIYCRGTIRWFDELKDVRIILSNDEEPAIGTRLLQDCIMTMDFIQNTLEIDKPSRSSLKNQEQEIMGES